MGLALREALTLAEPLRGSSAAKKTTLYPWRDRRAHVRSLVPHLAEKGVVRLAITPESYIDRIPECMIEAANRLDFPLIELPPKASFIDIIQPLTSRIFNIHANELRQSEALLRQFLDLILAGGAYGEIAALIARTLERPVLVIDRFRRLLGQSLDAEPNG
ncbi:MAG: PucR family transcriptional regulator ligand-binding domain-containing protein [Candidatus Bipolaricaulaceae bacterium]